MSQPIGTLYLGRDALDLEALGQVGEGSTPMSTSRMPRHATRRRRRRRHGQLEPPPPPAPPRDEVEVLREVDESLLGPEERAYLEARRTAEKKISLYREAVKIGLFIPLLLIPVVNIFAFIVLILGGIKLGRMFYRVMIEPGLRDRIVREEVSKRVQLSVHREREELEGQHARSLEELSASIAHEIRNPITAAKSLVQQMEEEPASSENVEYARVALGELERVEKSISHLLRYAREEDLRLQPTRMVDILDSALETFRDRSARAGVEIVRQFDCEGPLQGDPEKLRRVFINLIGNAIDALDEAGVDKPRIEVAMGENLAGSEVWVRVRDNGPGIDSETGDKIFNPFFTSKEGGTGLGLPITKKLVDAHGGRIEVSSEPGGGAEFVITFPKAPETARGGKP